MLYIKNYRVCLFIIYIFKFNSNTQMTEKKPKIKTASFHYVYQLVHETYGIFYIGKTNNTSRRLKEHQNGLKTKKSKMYEKMVVLGIEEFTMEVLFTYNNEWFAMLKETELICQQKLLGASVTNINKSIWRRYS